MKMLCVLAVLALLFPAWAVAADKNAAGADDAAYAANKYAQIEVARVRLGANPSPTTMATLIEAEDLLRRFRIAPAAQKPALRAQVDAAVARLDLETVIGGR